MPDNDKSEFEKVKDILDKELTDDDAVTQFIKKAISLNDKSELLKYIDQNKHD